MARIKYIAPAAEVAGTIGGVTYARGYTGKTCRTWRAPTNKRTVGQIFARQTLSYFAHLWFSELTVGERALWDAYALTCEFTDSLGDSYHLNGFNTFIRILATINAYEISAWPHTAPTASGFPLTLTLIYKLYGEAPSNGVLEINTIVDPPSPPGAVVFSVHTLRPITRVHPFKATIFKGYFPTNASTPLTIYTFAPFVATDMDTIQTLIVWHYLDATGRLSKPIPQLVVCGPTS